MRSLVDTNIWVYAYDARDAQKRDRARTVLGADPGRIWTSPQVMGELFVTLTRKLASPMGHAHARAIVTNLSRLNVVPLEAAQVLDAVDIAARHQLSYWDALLVAAARAARCERLLTEDLQSGTVIAGVRIENPFLPPSRRLSEAPDTYDAASTAWDEAALSVALAAYEAACRVGGMKPNAVHSYWDHARRFLDWRTGAYRPRGSSEGPRPVPGGAVSAAVLESQVGAYVEAVASAGLDPASVDTYRRHAMFFVRWLDGEFQPGARLAGRERPDVNAAGNADGRHTD